MGNGSDKDFGKMEAGIEYLVKGFDDQKKDTERRHNELKASFDEHKTEIFKRVNKNSGDLSKIKGIGTLLQAVWCALIMWLWKGK